MARANAQLADDPLIGDALMDFKTDLHFYSVALKNLLAALAFSQHITRDPKIGLLLKRIDQRLPHVTFVRDVQEHFDDYLRGKGKKQLIVDALDTPGRPQQVIVGPKGGPARKILAQVGQTESIEVFRYRAIAVQVATDVLEELAHVTEENLVEWFRGDATT